MDSMMNSMYQADEFVNLIYSILSGGLGIIVTLGAIIGLAVTIIVTVAQWVLLALPLFTLANKTNRKLSWIAWIPVLGEYCRMFTLCDIAGDKEFVLFGKLKIKSRILSFWIWVGVMLFGSLVWDFVLTLLGGLVSFTGVGPMVAFVLCMVPDAVLCFLEYVFLRDVLDIFIADKKSNNIWAIVATVLDLILPWRFASTICLFMLMNKEPLPKANQSASIPVQSQIPRQ